MTDCASSNVVYSCLVVCVVVRSDASANEISLQGKVTSLDLSPGGMFVVFL